MFIFKNFIFVFIFLGIVTRFVGYFLQKKMKKGPAAYVTFMLVGLFLFPIAIAVVGFDVVIAEYVASLLVWLVYDLIKAGGEG